MSMLAERKRKQKWSLNPRGKHWSEDVNKFGQKMLEKMGWTAGKGLGANEDGVTEHVKVSYKNDSKGMGFKDNGDQWTKHEADFTTLLESLGAGDDANKIIVPEAAKSLEKKSQASRARVHYHKFTRGKDLSVRSEKDIANIFGRKTLERPQETKQDEDDNSNDSKTEDKSFGVITVQAGNMTDYFKNKLSKLGGKLPTTNNDEKEEESESELTSYVGFGFSSNCENTPVQKINFISSSNEEENSVPPNEEEQNASKAVNNEKKRKLNSDEEEYTPKKSKKQKKKNMVFDNLGNDINTAEEVCYDNPCLKETDSPTPNGSKSAKKKKHVTFSSPIKEILNENEIQEESKKSKKKSKKKTSKHGIDNMAMEDISHVDTVPNEGQKKKSKKEKKSENGEETIEKENQSIQGIDNLACEEISLNEKNEEIRRYKQKKKAMENGLDNPACEEIQDDSITENTLEEISNKKTKIKKKGINNSVCEETSFNDSITEDPCEERNSKKSKRKKKFAENGLDNLGCEETSFNDSISEGPCEENNSKKSKKKKKKFAENGLDNLGCEENGIDNPACEEILNISFVENSSEENSKKLKRKKKLANNSTDNFEVTLPNGIVETEEIKTKKRKSLSDEIDTNLQNTPSKKKKRHAEETSEPIVNGIENLGCEINTIEENIQSMSDEIDRYETELENEMNQKKIEKQQNQIITSSSSSIKKQMFRKSLQDGIKSGYLKVGFVGANLIKLPGYGADLHLRPKPK